MHRIDTKTAQKDKFGAGRTGFTVVIPRLVRLPPIWMITTLTIAGGALQRCGGIQCQLEKGQHDQLLTAPRATAVKRNNPFGDIKSDGTVPTALENLGLGEAAKRDVGTGEIRYRTWPLCQW